MISSSLIVQLTQSFREVWSFALFEIILSVCENRGDPYIETHATRIRLWENIPVSPTAFMIPEFLVIQSEQSDSPGWDLYIYHTSSVRHWEWRAVSNSVNFHHSIPRYYTCRCPTDPSYLLWISGASLLLAIERRRCISWQFISPLFYASQRQLPNLPFHRRVHH